MYNNQQSHFYSAVARTYRMALETDLTRENRDTPSEQTVLEEETTNNGVNSTAQLENHSHPSQSNPTPYSGRVQKYEELPDAFFIYSE